ncbi:MAG TPA: YfhO family protein [Vicinamibacteria bacterium]|nr:YfhO family protein [Vicinamibacteria bacterium]
MKKSLPFAVVVVLPFLLYWKLFHPDPEDRQIFRGDFLNQHYVWKSYALSRVKAFELPLWNPHILGGEAFHANPQVGIFYPPTYLLLPFHSDGRVSYVALEAYQLLHQAFAGVGMLLLMRSLGAGTPGALAGAVVFMFTGFFTTPGHQAIVLTASWIPWVLLAIRRLFERKNAFRSILLALALAMMILAGHPQVAYYGLLLACAFALFEGGFRGTLVRFLPALLLGVGVAFVQLLPTYDLASESSRVELGYEYSTSFGFSPYFLSAVLAPRGQVPLPGQDPAAPLHVYAGVGTLLFAFIGVALSKERARIFFAAAALAALLLSFGKDSPIYDFFYAALPGLGSFRVPYRLLGAWGLGCSVVAGLGIEAMASASRKDRLRLRSVAQGAFVALLALWLWAALVHTRLLSNAGSLDPPDVERVVVAAHWAVLLLALHFLLFLLFLWRRQAREAKKDRYVLPAMVALLAIDMAAFVKDRAQHPYSTLARADERPVHRFLKAQGPKSRYATPSSLESYSMLFGTEQASGHAALVDSRYQALLDRAKTSANALSILNVKLVARSDATSAYPWCGARYASPLPILDLPPELTPAKLSVSPPIKVARVVFYWTPLGSGGTGVIEIGGSSHPLVGGQPLSVDFLEPTSLSEFRVLVDKGNPGIRIEDIEVDLNPIGLKSDFLEIDGMGINLHALPRAYFIVPSSVPSEIQTVESLGCWSVHQGIQVIDPETGEGASGFFRKDAAAIESYESERVEIASNSPRDGFLVFSDTYRPGWSAWVDGVKTPILRAQAAFRAVRVPAGKHRVLFLYRPASLRLGAAVSLLALAVLVLWPPISWIRRKRSTPTLAEIPVK